MLKYNCIATHQTLAGDEKKKQYTVITDALQVFLIPVSNDILAMNVNIPAGGSYSFMIMDQVAAVNPQDRFIISDPLTSELDAGDEFAVVGVERKGHVMGHTIIEGICIKK